jgi:DNA helicase-2/ATP-dependent DNA helicase PcrA
MQYNVPVRMKDRIPNIYDHWIARDILTYIRIAAGSRKRSDFLQIMNRPKRYIGRDSLCEDTVAFDEWEKMYDEQPWIAERIERLEYDVKMLKKMSPFAAVNYIRRGIGYDDYLKEYAEYRNINKDDLFDIIDELQESARGYKSYEEWSEHIADYSAEMKKLAAQRETAPNAVTLSTLHGSKGLEFDTVFIIDVNEGIMPYKKAVLDKDIEEERRLFFVGMTRAKTTLYLCSVSSLRDEAAEVSRFIEEAQTAATDKKS